MTRLTGRHGYQVDGQGNGLPHQIRILRDLLYEYSWSYKNKTLPQLYDADPGDAVYAQTPHRRRN